MNPIRHILVPTDFSEPARRALQYAGDLARRVGARLTVMYADRFVPPLDLSVEVAAWDDATILALEKRARAQLDAEIGSLVDSSVDATAVIRVATAADAIVSQGRESAVDLIIMGTHGRSGLPRLVFGSVTEAVMRRASVPVLAISRDTTVGAAVRTIVCCIDFSRAWVRAVSIAAALAMEDARFTVIGAVSDNLMDCPDALEEIKEWTPAELTSRCTFILLSTNRYAANVAEFADQNNADLIVATEGQARKLVEVLGGTVAERLLHRSHCPVLTVSEAATTTEQRPVDHRDNSVAMF